VCCLQRLGRRGLTTACMHRRGPGNFRALYRRYGCRHAA
jgi:hypothetical protein